VSAQIIIQAAQARCYECGSTQIANICHHCGRPMCIAHSPAVSDAAGKPLSVEFVGLGLKETKCGESAMHCTYCVHRLKPPSLQLIIAGSLVMILSVLILTSNFAVGFLGLLIGGGLATYGYHSNKRRREEILRSRPSLPMLPRFDSIHLREELSGRIGLDSDGRYHVTAFPVEGTLTIACTFGKPERERLEQYRKKYKLGEEDDETFHCGFALLRGQAGLKFNDEMLEEPQRNTVVALTGLVNAQPFLSRTDPRGSGEKIIRKYSLLDAAKTDSLPIRLIPSLLQEGGQRALEIEIQWAQLDPSEAELRITRIESMELSVPVAWGKIDTVSDGAVVGTKGSAEGDEAVRTISWRRLPVTNRERQEGRRSFFIKFEAEIDLLSRISGKAEVIFERTLSGLEDVALYYPLGGLREEEKAQIKTCVRADFNLSLAGLRYQEVRIVPDGKKPNDKDKQESDTFESVIPDHTTVIALTNAMSQEGFYLKRVIENPPRAGARANVFNRLWDIAGRRYIGVYPIDFHLILTGEEVYSGGIRAQGGTTRTTLSVQGTYTNPDITGMEAKVENVWIQLNYLIARTLQQLPKAASTARHEASESQKAEGSDLLEQPAVNSDRGERGLMLRKRLDQLTERLIDGRLSENLYLELKANIERDLDLL